MMELTLNLRERRLENNSNGFRVWRPHSYVQNISSECTALLLCDVWDTHWCRGARERLDAMIPRMAQIVKTARINGIHIIHAPSGTLNYYVDSPAKRLLSGKALKVPPDNIPHIDPPLPIDDSDGGSDSGGEEQKRVWTRQHPGIVIDEYRDVISDDGREIYGYLRDTGIEKLLIMGVHTNMCILHRSFGIKQMIRWGIDIALIRDLTDTMYNPAMLPYV